MYGKHKTFSRSDKKLINNFNCNAKYFSKSSTKKNHPLINCNHANYPDSGQTIGNLRRAQ